jgi:hypothetical protein
MNSWIASQKCTPYSNIRTNNEAKKKKNLHPHNTKSTFLLIDNLKLHSIHQFSVISVMTKTLKHTAITNKNTPLPMHRCNLKTQSFLQDFKKLLSVAFSVRKLAYFSTYFHSTCLKWKLPMVQTGAQFSEGLKLWSQIDFQAVSALTPIFWDPRGSLHNTSAPPSSSLLRIPPLSRRPKDFYYYYKWILLLCSVLSAWHILSPLETLGAWLSDLCQQVDTKTSMSTCPWGTEAWLCPRVTPCPLWPLLSSWSFALSHYF